MNPIVSYTTTIVKLHYLNYTVVEVPPAHLVTIAGDDTKNLFNKRLIIRLDDTIEWQCGLLAMGEGSGCITLTAPRLKKIGKQIGDDVLVSFFPDESKYGVPVAEELQVYWDQVPVSFDRFEALKPSMQRYILNYIQTAKSTDKRLERTLLLMENLQRSFPGKETFRELLGK